MDSMMKKLRTELLVRPGISIVGEKAWSLPLISYEVTFSQVKRLKMDILMKMMLAAFKETEIRRAAALADMLLVEELFIRDLIEKMKRARLIRFEPKGYELTDKGHAHLEEGIFEEEMDGGEALVFHSPAHQNFLLEIGEVEAAGSLPTYRHAEESMVDTGAIKELLSAERSEETEGGFRVIVTGITGCEKREEHGIACAEFQLYDRDQDIFYARVWNTGSGSWDEVLSKAIEEREVVAWREAMKK